ncbi:MAG TPA: ribokinase [Humisphaera sp.]
MPHRPPIVVVGSINVDLVARVDRFPAPGETIAGGDLRQIPGGKGANQAVAAARLGGAVTMVGRVGDDAFGEPLRRQLEAEGIDVTQVHRTADTPTGSAVILVDAAGRNSIVVSPGANGRLSAADVRAAEASMRSAACVVAQLEVPISVVEVIADICRAAGVPMILDPAPVPPGGLPAALFRVDVLTPNRTEALQLVGRHPAEDVEPEVLARELLGRGPRAVVLKLDADGAVIADASGVRTVAAFPTDVVDSTAAGDAFTGALAVAMAEGRSVDDAVVLANAAGALCCEGFGAQPSLPRREDVERMALGRRVRA